MCRTPVFAVILLLLILVVRGSELARPLDPRIFRWPVDAR